VVTVNDGIYTAPLTLIKSDGQMYTATEPVYITSERLRAV
jgi:hypothetical protein